MDRRGFVKLCASTAAGVGSSPALLAAASEAPFKPYERVKLTDSKGLALNPDTLVKGENYIFNYPYISTPCFLLNLGREVLESQQLHTESGQDYRWPGGVGKQSSIVSFSAICAHKMSHPAKAVSFINYRPETVSFRNHKKQLVKRDGVIFCCSEKSVYDPARGAQVIGGPAKQPLCTILIEYDAEENALYALGSYGGEMFAKFFEKFTPRLQVEFKRSDVKVRVESQTQVLPISEYSQTQMLCGA